MPTPRDPAPGPAELLLFLGGSRPEHREIDAPLGFIRPVAIDTVLGEKALQGRRPGRDGPALREERDAQGDDEGQREE